MRLKSQASSASLRRFCSLDRRRRCSTNAILDSHSLYTRQAYEVPSTPPRASPVLLPGRGLGLQATSDLLPGELVLLCRPLGAVAYGPAGTLPSNHELVKAIMTSQLSRRDLEWLQLLAGSRGLQQPAAHDDDLAQASRLMTDQSAAEEDSASVSSSSNSNNESSSSSNGSHGSENGPRSRGEAVSMASVVPLDEALVAQAVSCNSYGEACEDVAVSTLREVEPLAFTGLFPELALVNHSCSPNTTQLLVGGALFLRAVRPILEGDEVTTCYLGMARFTHVANRRAQLAAQYGFHCQCSRCLLEHALFPTRRYPDTDARERGLAHKLLSVSSPSASSVGGALVQWLLDRVFGAGRFSVGAAKDNGLLEEVNEALVSSLEPSVQEALTARTRGPARQQAVLDSLTAAIARVEAELQELGLSSRDRVALLASVGGLHRSRYELLEVSGLGSPEEELAALQAWLELVDAVARGSDTHMFVALKHVAKVKAVRGAATEEARRAELACAAAHFARYGKLDPGLLRGLMQVRARMVAGSAMASRISVMAWENDRNLAREKEDDPLGGA